MEERMEMNSEEMVFCLMDEEQNLWGFETVYIAEIGRPDAWGSLTWFSSLLCLCLCISKEPTLPFILSSSPPADLPCLVRRVECLVSNMLFVPCIGIYGMLGVTVSIGCKRSRVSKQSGKFAKHANPLELSLQGIY